MGSDEEKYKPKSIFTGSNSFRSLRVFGELHLEGYQVTFSKDNFAPLNFEPKGCVGTMIFDFRI